MDSNPPPSDLHPDLLPARMLNEYVYCPRLYYLEHVQGEWEDSADTEEGRHVHRRVDQEGGKLPEAEQADGERIHARSVLLSAPGEGLIARIDLLEGEGSVVTPVDYKRGAPPDLPEGAWPPERVQLCAQGLVLRENGYTCDRGVIYYAQARRRVEVVFDDALIDLTRRSRTEAIALATREVMPPPLDDSPKCPRCSLVGICLPDETRFLEAGEGETPRDPDAVRRLFPARDDALPVHVQVQGAKVGIQGERLIVREKDQKLADARLLDVSQLVLHGNVQVSTQALRRLIEDDIPVSYLSYGGRFVGLAHGMSHKNVELRLAQYRAATDPAASLALARRFVRGKILNARTLLRRNHREPEKAPLPALKRWARRAQEAPDLGTLLGLEGMAGRDYFSAFAGMLGAKDQAAPPEFDFHGRNRRPPRDPVNALLSFAYALLAKDWTVTLLQVGFDPYLGFFHQPRYGRPALALDLMEEFRPLIADSVVIGAINNGEVAPADFIRRGPAVALKPLARRAFIEAYERRMNSLITHPVFGYRLSYRRVLEVQARLLARHLLGEIREYPEFRTR